MSAEDETIKREAEIEQIRKRLQEHEAHAKDLGEHLKATKKEMEQAESPVRSMNVSPEDVEGPEEDEEA